MSTQLTRIEELFKQNPDAVMTIIQKNSEGGNARLVRAPLPDGYGMSVGSAFTDPNNIDLAGNTGGGRMGQLLGGLAKYTSQYTGISTRATQRSNVFYAGPEPTEVSFELNFSAYYSAYDEVVKPAARLMMMSVGTELPLSKLNPFVDEFLQEEGVDETDDDGGITEGFGLIRSAGEVEIRFGKAMGIKRAYVSSVGVKFSNVLDNQGYPMSADCSVTVKVIRNPTQKEVGDYFGGLR